MIRVHHYGLHYASGSIGFLMQPGATQSIYPVDCPFYIQRTGYSCPHRVDIDQRNDRYAGLLEDPLLAWMARPKGVALLQGVEHTSLVEKLAEIYWPTKSLLSPAWGYRRIWRQELSLTNFAPWILVGATSTEMDLLWNAVSLPRPVLAITKEPLPGLELTTNLSTVPDQPALRQLGAWAAYERLKRP